MVVLRPGVDEIDTTLLAFGPLTKKDDSYTANIEYDGEMLFCQFDGWEYLGVNDEQMFNIQNKTTFNNYIEDAIRQKLVEDSQKMFKRGFTDQMLVEMQTSIFSETDSMNMFPVVEAYDSLHNSVEPLAGCCDVIFCLESVEFKQTQWNINWTLKQIRVDNYRVIGQNYMFVDDKPIDDDHSDNEHTDDNFMFVPNESNE